MARWRSTAVLGTSAIALIATLGVSWGLLPWTARAASQQTGGWAVLNVELARKLGRTWEDGWNRRDLDTIMEPFAADVVFSSPAVPRGTGNPAQTTIRGYEALRKYIGDAVRGPGNGGGYTLDTLYVGTDSVVLHYSCKDKSGKRTCTGADIMRVNAAGKIVEWRCHYTVGSGETDLIKLKP